MSVILLNWINNYPLALLADLTININEIKPSLNLTLRIQNEISPAALPHFKSILHNNSREASIE